MSLCGVCGHNSKHCALLQQMKGGLMQHYANPSLCSLTSWGVINAANKGDSWVCTSPGHGPFGISLFYWSYSFKIPAHSRTTKSYILWFPLITFAHFVTIQSPYCSGSFLLCWKCLLVFESQHLQQTNKVLNEVKWRNLYFKRLFDFLKLKKTKHFYGYVENTHKISI